MPLFSGTSYYLYQSIGSIPSLELTRNATLYFTALMRIHVRWCACRVRIPRILLVAFHLFPESLDLCVLEIHLGVIATIYLGGGWG